MRGLEPLGTIANNTVQNGKCVLDLPIGMTYDFIQFKTTNVTAAEMQNFKVKVGANPIVDVPSAQICEDLNVYYDRKSQTGYFTLWFYRPEMDTEEERMLTSLGTLGLSQVTITWDNNSASPSPSVEASAMRRAGEPLGLVTKIKEYPSAVIGAGKGELTEIIRGPRIQAIHLGKSDISAVELDVNSGNGTGKLIDATKSLLEVVQKQHKRVPVTAKYTHIDFNLIGKIAGSLKTASLQDMRVRPTLDTQGSVPAYVEYLDTLSGV